MRAIAGTNSSSVEETYSAGSDEQTYNYEDDAEKHVSTHELDDTGNDEKDREDPE